jgi:hypothetical protein
MSGAVRAAGRLIVSPRARKSVAFDPVLDEIRPDAGNGLSHRRLRSAELGHI